MVLKIVSATWLGQNNLCFVNLAKPEMEEEKASYRLGKIDTSRNKVALDVH
jgi:hypothetical protein